MNSNSPKKLKKLFEILDNFHNITRKLLYIGLSFFLILLIFGLALVLITKIALFNNSSIYNLAITLIRTSFTLLIEVLFVCLLIDFAIKKYEEDDDD